MKTCLFVIYGCELLYKCDALESGIDLQILCWVKNCQVNIKAKLFTLMKWKNLYYIWGKIVEEIILFMKGDEKPCSYR